MKQKTSTSPVRNKSQSKQTPSNSPRKPASSVNTVQKKPAKLSQQAIVLKMKALRQKLCSTLDAYILILETNAPMRCLDHNSVLSLYCQTQQRLLCANCVYRSNNHKLHRVFPIQKCYKQINRDVEQLARQVDREIGWADSQAKAIFQLFKEEEKNTNQAILNLAQIYQQIQFELSKSYEQCKRKIISAMDTIFTKKQSLLLQLQFFKDIYQKNKPANVDQFKNGGDPAITEYHILFNHLIGNALIDFGKLEGMKLSEGPSKIKSLEKQEMVKLKEFKGLMESWREFEREKEGITKEREHDQIKREKEQVIRQKQQELKESQRQRQRVRQINRVKSQTTHRAYF